ncbi:MAG: carboxypeptidase-like regulatory domain-containing protein, partial [Mucilaginibacter sp.]
MPSIQKIFCFLVLSLLYFDVWGQSATGNVSLIIQNEKSQPVDGATVKLLANTKPVKTVVSNASGKASFQNVKAGTYAFIVTFTGYKPQTTHVYNLPAENIDTIKLQPLNTVLQQVDVTAHTAAIEQQKGKVIVNVDASVTNAGITVLEVLEKSPGVTVDKSGGIALQGK